MIKAVFFDFDGVLVESVEIKTKAFARLVESEGDIVVSEMVKYHLKNTGVSRYDKFRYLYEKILKRELTKDIFDGLCAKFEKLVVEEVIAAPYVAGAEEFLKANLKKYAFYIVSATPQSEIETIVQRRMMGRYFKGIFGAPTGKKDVVQQVIFREKIDPQEAVYVGDAVSDYEAATANGVYFIARINNNEPVFKGIDSIRITDLTDLSGVLNKINDMEKRG